MTLCMHKDCHEAAVERPDAESSEIPAGFPFTCLSCLDEIESPSDLFTVELMSQ